MLYRGMNRTQLDAAYNNSAAVPERDTQLSPTGAARNATVRREHDGHLNIHYGGNSRERLDLFLAANPKAPILAFIHGGYWQMYNGIGIAPEIRISCSSRLCDNADGEGTGLGLSITYDIDTQQRVNAD